VSDDLGQHLRLLGDELRALGTLGLQYSSDKPHDRDRYEHTLDIAAELFAIADERPAAEIRKTVFQEISHIAPVAVGDAAVFDDDGRILLIRRADDGLWAMPGGAFEVGETAAEGAMRETREEAGVDVEALDLIGVYDSRLTGTPYPLQLYMFVFHCKYLGDRPEGPSTPHEVLDVRWFSIDEPLPPLSAGHERRIPDAIAFHRHPGKAWFDRPEV
jgi:8-oxo-dGTP pyrophosphatase MutT (NUDIX family)